MKPHVALVEKCATMVRDFFLGGCQGQLAPSWTSCCLIFVPLVGIGHCVLVDGVVIIACVACIVVILARSVLVSFAPDCIALLSLCACMDGWMGEMGVRKYYINN